MSDRPTGRGVACPECDAMAMAVVPKNSEIVEQEADPDGKVWVTCSTCEERFPVHYRLDA